MGSPPRRRGKGYREFGIDISDRITPAQAGKSVAPRQKRSALWDHPRVGGEKLVFHVGQRGQRGSPPRGRGKVFDPYFLEYGSKDHPRVGGEKLLQFALPLLLTGSPPRGRGKGRPPCTVQTIQRITPAWAGKRRNRGCCAAGKGDHPRVGGEKPPPLEREALYLGSPPRGRGKVRKCADRSCSRRITPAWAGKRLKRSHRSGIFISGPIPFHSVLHRPAGSGGSRAGRDGSPAGQPQNAGPA